MNKKVLFSLLFVFFCSLCLDSNVAFAATNVSDLAELKNAIGSGETKITVTKTISITDTDTVDGQGKTIKLAENVENMFSVGRTGDLTLENFTLDGQNEGRFIFASEGAKVTIKNSALKNGSTDTFEKNIVSGVNKQQYSGGAIYATGATLNIENTTFSDNTTKSSTPVAENPGDPPLPPHGGAIFATANSVVNIKGGGFYDNSTGKVNTEYGAHGEGGAIKLENSTLKINDEITRTHETQFIGNHVADSSNTGGLQGGSIEATGSKVYIYGTTFNIPGPFNTGGAIKFEGCEEAIIKYSYFQLEDNKGQIGVAGGAITSEGSNLTMDTVTLLTGKGTYVQESGGLIQVVGTGTFNLKNSRLTGSGIGWNQTGVNKTAKYGGAIVFYDHSSVNALIEDTKINDFTAEISGGAIALNAQIGKGKQTETQPESSTNLTIKNTKIIDNVTYAWNNTAYGGGIFNGIGNTVVIEGGQISSSQYSSTGGAIYNAGTLTVTGTADVPAKIINNKAYHMAAGILNDGYLKVDYAQFSGNQKGDRSNANQHVYNTAEMSGENIYAVQDVIITPNAKFDGRDIRVLDGQSAVLLTGPLTNQINISVSEQAKEQSDNTKNNPQYPVHPKLNEPMVRHIGYVVAKGTDGYTATAEDAKLIHYVTKYKADDEDNIYNQASSEETNHTGVGAWDYVLNPQTNQIVLGQRAKMVYHGNSGKIGTQDSQEQIYTIYTNVAPYSDIEQMLALDTKPTREGYTFVGWYYDDESTNTNGANAVKKAIQNLRKDIEDYKQYLFDFSEKRFTDDKPTTNAANNTTLMANNSNANEITGILDPYIVNTYAGWAINPEIKVSKTWSGASETEKQSVTIQLNGAEKASNVDLNTANNWTGTFDKHPAYEWSFNKETQTQQISDKSYSVTETNVPEGFSVSYLPQSIEGKNLYDNAGFTVTNTKTQTYKVTYQFVSGTAGKTLPEGVNEYLPGTQENVAVGTTITPEKITQTIQDETNDGTWTFQSWNPENVTVKDKDVKFTGTWVFTPKETPKPWMPVKPIPDSGLLNKEDHKAYMFGYPDWTFRQEGNMTRAEATAMFARLMKDYPKEQRTYNINYPDVAMDQWHYEAVGYMSEMNIVEGYQDGTFQPNAPITRAEFATMASRFDELAKTGGANFIDVENNHWALAYINSAATKGWVNGYPDGTFKPNQSITRAEVVTVTNRMLNRKADEVFVIENIDKITNFTDLTPAHWAYYNIQEATNGHDYNRLENGIDEDWIQLNGEEFRFAVSGYKFPRP
ncbi:S-layer homology domain-containing protein [Peptoniphilus sp. KCTC 25270]|uniref:S-layer homology domain-containing protein n=1 Tax=Peptoniphilus sp. KCTC 25270 TaxID=2897414 RepID=UPI001E490AC3|nr:S-layer homology domain-containing protein [Peptoniphilus sp. KCTC 25270]MCD1147757.1 S-layer homology domain-containing protein [Peptoniphilus sp. KCTC 25270]